MPSKEELIRRLCEKPMPVDFSVRELNTLMNKCGCSKYEGGRGSGVGYVHDKSKRAVQFDRPHPGNNLYRYQVKMVIEFLKSIGEI